MMNISAKFHSNDPTSTEISHYVKQVLMGEVQMDRQWMERQQPDNG